MRNKLYLLLAFSLILASCAPTRIVKPLEKGEKTAGLTLGGSLINFGGVVIPIPMTSVYGAYGIKDQLTGFGGINTTSLAFGVFQMDLGVVKEILPAKGYRPGLSVSPVANIMLDKWEWNFKFYPQLDMNAYWVYGDHDNLVFTGFSNWFELSSNRYHGISQKTHWLPDWHIGHIFSRPRMQYSLEMRYIAPFSSNRNIVVNYISPGNRGTVGLYFGINRKF